MDALRVVLMICAVVFAPLVGVGAYRLATWFPAARREAERKAMEDDFYNWV